jgi:cob(I)alamin adenosyltransferase
MLEKGLVQVYTGNSEQTHFVPMGLSLRAAGQKLRTHMTYFLPPDLKEGANVASVLLKPYLVVEHAELANRPQDGKWNMAEIDEVNHSLQKTKHALLSGKFDIVVLDGMNRLLAQDILAPDDIVDLIDQKPDHVELVFTGPGASDDLIERADLVTEMVYNVRDERSEKDFNHGDSMTPSEVVTGNGKGKTTYCLGKAMLMSCMGVRSTMLQFIKSPKAYGEVKAMEKLSLMDIKTMGKGFLDMESAVSSKKHMKAAKQAWEECLREIFSLEYGVIVLDEINIATYYGLINAERVREMMFLKPEKLHLLLSGRNAHLEVREEATSVIEMREIKHPYRKGIKARKGIEF